MAFDLTGMEVLSDDFKKMGAHFSEKFANILQALFSFPLNILGTSFHDCLKVILELFFISKTFRVTIMYIYFI